MNIEEQISYWIDGAEHDLTVAEHLFDSGDFSWCLFAGHLVLEKMLKALYVRDNKEIPPKTHNLISLINQINCDLPKKAGIFLVKINSASIITRYPEDLEQIKKNYTEPIVKEIIAQTKEVLAWIKQKL